MPKHPKIKGGYVIIPKSTIKCNQYKKLRAHTRIVYTAILTEFIRDNTLNPENKVKITHNQIEDISGASHSSVVRAMRELREEGFLRVLKAGGLVKRYSIYQLNKRFTDCGDITAYW